MSEIKVNKISPRSGTTVTLGDSGDTFTIPAGVSITNSGTASGFGATGAASWNTTVKTGDFTAISGEGYFVNTTSGEIDVTLPAGTAGAVVAIKDYAGTFDTNAVTLTPNGSDKIGGVASIKVLDTEGQAVTIIFIDSTQGWLVTDDGLQSSIGSGLIEATGGTITTCGNDRIHTFTGPGTFEVTKAAVSATNNLVSYVVVAGGGGSGRSYGGGAGAGGYREVKSPVTPYTASPLDGYPSAPNRVTVSAQSYPITVGAGGTKAAPSTPAGDGGVSTFSTITSAGGGNAGHFDPNNATGGDGGSGGGGADGASSGGNGNTPPTSPAQGNNGGTSSPPGAASGGGGAGGVGVNANTPGPRRGGNGGAGVASEITGSSVTRAGGGGGFGVDTLGTGGSGGGGNGACAGSAGTANTGGGAGGAGSQPNPGTLSTGGSGIVIIRYKFQ